MEKIEDHINRINNKLQELLKRHASMAKETAQQQESIRKMKEEIALKDAKINTLEQQQHILKSAAGKMNEEDRKAFEQVINRYIREIDKCINLLNE